MYFLVCGLTWSVLFTKTCWMGEKSVTLLPVVYISWDCSRWQSRAEWPVDSDKVEIFNNSESRLALGTHSNLLNKQWDFLGKVSQMLRLATITSYSSICEFFHPCSYGLPWLVSKLALIIFSNTIIVQTELEVTTLRT